MPRTIKEWSDAVEAMEMFRLEAIVKSLDTLFHWEMFSEEFTNVGVKHLHNVAKGVLRLRIEEKIQALNAEKEITSEVQEMYQWGQAAVGDMVSGGIGDFSVENEIKADQYWDDPDCLQDLFGDKIYDATTTFISKHNLPTVARVRDQVYILFCQEFLSSCPHHASLVKVMHHLIKQHSK